MSNTADLIERLTAIDKEHLRGQIPISFDVISLYTNINTEEATTTTLEYVRKHNINLHGLQTHDLFELLDLVLNNNVFQFQTNYYKQIRGLAMGNRISGTLAIVYMDKYEQTHVYRKYQPILYGRCVDDIGTTAKSMKDATDMLADLNSKHPTIRFELETPDETNFLPILDI